MDKALADGEDMLVILAHGGTQMAALERYALPQRGYYKWCGPNAGGYVLDARDWAAQHGTAPGQDRAVHQGEYMLIFWAVLGGLCWMQFLRTRLAASARGC